MSNMPALLAIDQGTTSSRAIVFAADGTALASAQQEFRQIYPNEGWVEHDPEEIWSSTLAVCRQALERLPAAVEVVAIGITNQRETTVLWERATGRPLHNAIVWQDRRTAAECARLRAAGHEDMVSAKTGLLLDPYFSATKLAWLLDHVEGARERAARGELAFGTIDSFLLWRLTSGKVHATDITNASRTLLYDIHEQRWDEELLALFRIPRTLLPEVRDCVADFGSSDPALLGRTFAIAGIAGDQQAAAIGQACIEPGMVKSTYGTGCFMLMNTGSQAVRSHNRLLTTVAYRVDGRISYAVEGSIFVAGSAVQWLRDRMKLIECAAETEALAAGLTSNKGMYLVPAFTGLGAPYWNPHARAALFGLTLDSGAAELARATLESMCYQTRDLVEAMIRDGANRPTALRVDGGMVANNWMLQFLADVLEVPVERPRVTETTALGAAFLAGLRAGLLPSFTELGARWHRDRLFTPTMAAAERDKLLDGWDRAVRQVQ
ncbi:MAG TPA: glycerol kinase GlpK, partial [Candidatus Competibacteraceae bacterium]|nr:glycerol kinase GlpK [Candidatus Competibacteraceae bacterium]